MRVLFLHNNFPAQYRHVATRLAAESGHQVVFGTKRDSGQLPGVQRVLFKPGRSAKPETHHYVRNLEDAVLNGQAVYRMATELKRQGFTPDVVCGHSGWGPTLFVKDVFPDARLLCYFEWFYRAFGTDADFLPESAITEDDACRIRTRNAAILLDLAACDRGLAPTEFQRQQFPAQFQDHFTTLHDGIDTDYFKPASGTGLKLPGLDLAEAEEIVTYATRGMEPYRGFPQFMAAAAVVQKRRPKCHIVVVGEDRVAYGRRLPEGQTYKNKMLAELDFDPARLHFTGLLPYDQYLQVLQASAAHVYLTVPFVLSWSALEAMATGCLMIASDTEPVREFVADGRNGLLVDFFDSEALAERIEAALERPERYAKLRRAARATIVDGYDLKAMLPRHIDLITQVARD